jgi:hypothetical protein
VYCTIRGDEGDSEWGRLVKSIDDGDNWSTELLGDADTLYPYAIFADRNTLILDRDDATGATYYPQVITRTDAYNIVIVSEDDTSQSSYGEYCRTITDQQVQTRDVGERIGNGIIDLYKDPIETYDVRQKVDTAVELGKTYRVKGTNTFPLLFPIRFTNPFPIPSGAVNVCGLTYHYPRDRMDVKLGKELDDINSTLSDLMDKYIEEHQGDEMAVAMQDGTDGEPGYARTPTGKVTRPRGSLSRGQNYVLNRLKRNGWGRATSW